MSRNNIYYWKCDRPVAFHRKGPRAAAEAATQKPLLAEIARHFNEPNITLAPRASQGNHLTWTTQIKGTPLFIRVENGPERDFHLEMESTVMQRVAETGVRVPKIYGFDVSRERVPFAWQAIELLPFSDLNQCNKAGPINVPVVATSIGEAIGRWQNIRPDGFGVLDLDQLRATGRFQGFHNSYADYFLLNLEAHLAFLTERQFFTEAERQRVKESIERHQDLLRLGSGCLVHKDLALWNVLGTPHSVEAFIDFDDAISGDPTDDLSLLGCFHNGAFLEFAVIGYRSLQPEPDAFLQRFWLHLLRNMIVKAVIRVGAGYFEKSADFFLVGASSSGDELRAFTRARIDLAIEALKTNAPLSCL